jgi:hypothetical protein
MKNTEGTYDLGMSLLLQLGLFADCQLLGAGGNERG